MRHFALENQIGGASHYFSGSRVAVSAIVVSLATGAFIVQASSTSQPAQNGTVRAESKSAGATSLAETFQSQADSISQQVAPTQTSEPNMQAEPSGTSSSTATVNVNGQSVTLNGDGSTHKTIHNETIDGTTTVDISMSSKSSTSNQSSMNISVNSNSSTEASP